VRENNNWGVEDRQHVSLLLLLPFSISLPLSSSPPPPSIDFSECIGVYMWGWGRRV